MARNSEKKKNPSSLTLEFGNLIVTHRAFLPSHSLMQPKSYFSKSEEEFFSKRRFKSFRSTAGLFVLAVQTVLVSKIATSLSRIQNSLHLYAVTPGQLDLCNRDTLLCTVSVVRSSR